jgi:hypothetical protein
MTWSTRATAPSPDCWLPVRSRANRRRCGKCGAMLSANDMVLLGLSGGDGSVWQRGIACQTVERECSTLMNRPKSEHAMSLKPEKSVRKRVFSTAQRPGGVVPEKFQSFSANLKEISQKIEFTFISARAEGGNPCASTRFAYLRGKSRTEHESVASWVFGIRSAKRCAKWSGWLQWSAHCRSSAWDLRL